MLLFRASAKKWWVLLQRAPFQGLGGTPPKKKQWNKDVKKGAKTGSSQIIEQLPCHGQCRLMPSVQCIAQSICTAPGTKPLNRSGWGIVLLNTARRSHTIAVCVQQLYQTEMHKLCIIYIYIFIFIYIYIYTDVSRHLQVLTYSSICAY